MSGYDTCSMPACNMRFCCPIARMPSHLSPLLMHANRIVVAFGAAFLAPLQCHVAGLQMLHHWQMVLWKCSRYEAAHPALAGRLIKGAVVLDQLKLRWVPTQLDTRPGP